MNTLIGLPGRGRRPARRPGERGMVQGAVYDAVNAIEPQHYRPYLLSGVSRTCLEDAAVAAAAYGVLRNIVATVRTPAPAATRAGCSTLATQYASALAAIPDGPFTRRAWLPGRRRPTR